MKGTKGFTIYACFGQYGGFQIERSNLITRIVIGWVSICLLKSDVESMLYNAAELIKYYQHKENTSNLDSFNEDLEKVTKQ